MESPLMSLFVPRSPDHPSIGAMGVIGEIVVIIGWAGP
jgi:hypothetical protein